MNKIITIRKRMLILLMVLIGTLSEVLAANRFYLEPINIEPGKTKQLSFVLENTQDFFGFQADITLPEGLDFVKTNGKMEFSLSNRADNSFTTVCNLVTEKTLRIGAFSTQHKAFTGNAGELLTIKVRASETFTGGHMTLKRVRFADATNQDVKIADQTFCLGITHGDRFYIPDFKIGVGETKTITLHLENESLLTAFQLDLYLPNELQLVENSFTLSSRCSADHQITIRDHGDGCARIACFSISNTAFSGNKGGLLNFKVKANKMIEEKEILALKQLICSTVDAKELILANSVTSIVTEYVLIEKITMDQEALAMIVGDSKTIKATVTPNFVLNKNLVWTSNHPEIAEVSSQGVVKAVGIGVATITATATDGSGVSDSCEVIVSGIPTQIESIKIVAEGNTQLKEGETLKLRAEVLPETAIDKTVVWSSSNEKMAIVKDGYVIARHQTGTVTITASSSNGIKGTINLTIVPTPVDSLVISASSKEMKLGDTQLISVKINPSTATDKSLVWSSSDDKILTVDQNGQVKAVAPGVATIQVQSSNGISASVQITVKPILITSITIPTTLTLEIGDKYKVVPVIAPENASQKFVECKSSNEKVAVVVDDHVVAHDVGEAILTCSATDGSCVSANCIVKVVKFADAVTISMSEVKLEVGTTTRLTAQLHPANAYNTELTWASTNESVVSISQDGLLLAIAEGEADVIVHTQNPHYVADSCHVTVEVKSGIGPVSLDDVKIIHKGKHIVIKNCSDAQLFDLYGKKYVGKVGLQEVRFMVHTAGSYIVKIGKDTLKLVIKKVGK